MSKIEDHVAHNREIWDGYAPDFYAAGERAWASPEPIWGIFEVPERVLGVLPDDLTGQSTIELGCGTGYVSSWLARRGATPTGLDNSPKQLESARAFQARFGLSYPLHLGNAEATPFADESFDFAISEYGASLWCDPYRWIPEAARILRPGSPLIFLVSTGLMTMCSPEGDDDPVGDRLLRDYFGLHSIAWQGGGVEFHIGFGDWVRLFGVNGFEIEDYVEVRPPEDSTTTYPHVDLNWARRWPCEEVWKVRKR